MFIPPLLGKCIMVKTLCVALGVLICLSDSSLAQEPARARPNVEFRWIEDRVIQGLTEDQGKPTVCGGEDWYAHLKPVLTRKDIASARLTHLHMANADQYAVEFTLTPDALNQLAKACGDAPGKSLTVYVDGRWYGSSYFNKATPKKFTPPAAGFMNSRSHAEQILAASR